MEFHLDCRSRFFNGPTSFEFKVNWNMMLIGSPHLLISKMSVNPIMRRLILELYANEMKEFPGFHWLRQVQTLEVLTFLKGGPDEWALICRLELNDSSMSFEDVFSDELGEAKLLEEEKDGGRIYYIKKGKEMQSNGPHMMPIGGYMSTPYEIKDGMLKITFLGNENEINGFMVYFKKLGVRFRIVLLMDAKFLPSSPLSYLTEKQKEVLTMAFNLGYYDVPRRIESKDIAKRLGIRGSTLVLHRRKAEKRLIAEVIGKTD
jgi:DNA-binding CsgD family transcriptional regulator